MKAKQERPVITLEHPWYRCAHGTEFRSPSGKKPLGCPRTPSCKDADIEMVVDIDLNPSHARKET